MRDLGLSKISLMAKNVFHLINNANVWWVSIMNLKYGNFNVWKDNVPANCSWFYRGLYRNAKHIRPFLWINSINPALISFWNDPWYFQIPLSHKPTYLNMDYVHDNFNFVDLICGSSWNIDNLHLLFGPYLNDIIYCHSQLQFEHCNRWVWYPKSRGIKLSAMIYSHFNQTRSMDEYWQGWSKVWKLRVAPRVKHFLWLMFHDAVITQEYLYRLNLGPQTLCCLCNLHAETIEHLFHSCVKAQEIWSLISTAFRKSIFFPQGITSGNWLLEDYSGNDLFSQSVIAAGVWFLWKARCKKVFSNIQLNTELVSVQAIGHAREFLYSYYVYSRKFFYLSFVDSPILITAAMVNEETSMAGCGFVVLDFNSSLISIGSCRCYAGSTQEADAMSIRFALQNYSNWESSVKTVLTTNEEMIKAVKEGCFANVWRLNLQVNAIKELIGSMGSLRLIAIPKSWNHAALSLALHGLNHHEISLFLQGKELPGWIMKSFRHLGICCGL